MDIFGNKKPIQIDSEEWWYNGRIIRKQNDYRLPSWISFADDESTRIEIHEDKKSAIKFCQNNPCVSPNNMANDYLK